MKKKNIVVIVLVALLALSAVSVATASFIEAPIAPQVVDYQISSLGLSSTDIKVLEWDVADAQAYIDNWMSEKLRRTKGRMVMATINDPQGLSTKDRGTAASMLSGIIVTGINDIPENVQDFIVEKSNLLSAAERTALIYTQP